METFPSTVFLNKGTCTRNIGDSTKGLHYQDLEAIESSGIPFHLATALRLIDDVSDIYEMLMSVYVTRGIGKILKNHNIELSADEAANWRNMDAAKILWEQIKPCVLIFRKLQILGTELGTFLTGVNQLFTAKEATIIPDIMKDAILQIIDIHMVADLIFSKKPSIIESIRSFYGLASSLREKVAEADESNILNQLLSLERNTNLLRLVELIKPFRIQSLLLSLCDYISIHIS